MKKRYLKLVSIIGVAVVVISVLTFTFIEINKPNVSESTIISVNSQFYVRDETVIEIAPDKKLYEHNFDGEVKLVEENTKAVFIQNEMRIDNDGSIYMEGEKIATIEGAVSGSYTSNNIAVLTENCEVFEKQIYISPESSKFKSDISTDFEYVATIEGANKLIKCESFTYVLTEKGEVYRKGSYFDFLVLESFTKVDTDAKIIDISGSSDGLILLDSNSNMYGLIDYAFDHMGGALELKHISKNINKISAISYYGTALNTIGNIEVWGVKPVRKGYEEMKKTLKYIKNADNVLNNGLTIFVFNDNKILRTIVNYK